MARIEIPKNPDELIVLAKGIVAKHKAQHGGHGGPNQ
jgi:hypothetical protein